MKKLIIIALMLVVFGCNQKQESGDKNITKIEHGWKGRYLEAYRMKTRDGGMYNIQFKEIEFKGIIDRVEVSLIIQNCGGTILSGDYGGLYMVMFKGMNTKEKTDSVIRVILPKLEQWYSK